MQLHHPFIQHSSITACPQNRLIDPYPRPVPLSVHTKEDMPPIPPALPHEVQLEMDALRKQYHVLDGLITRLKNLSGGTLAVQQELSRNARDESKSIEAKIEVSAPEKCRCCASPAVERNERHSPTHNVSLESEVLGGRARQRSGS